MAATQLQTRSLLLLAFAPLILIGCFELPGDLGGPPPPPVVTIRNTDFSYSVPCTLDVAVSDPDGDALALQFRLNGELSLWTSLQPSGSILLLVVTAEDSVTLSARCRDTDNNTSPFSPTLPLFYANLPPLPPVGPEGYEAQLIGVADTFYTAAIDPEGDWVSLRFDPGNGDLPSPWSPHYPSGTRIGFVYTYRAAGMFLMRAQARDIDGRVSQWSSGLSIRVRNQPQRTGNVSIPGGARAVCERSGFVYVATAGRGLQTVDANDPFHPTVAGEIGNFTATMLRRNERTLLALVPYAPDGRDSVFAFDITNPAAPTTLSRAQIQHAACLDVEADLAVAGSTAPLSALTILDISQPDTLRTISVLTVGSALSVVLRFPYVYMITQDRNLYVINIATPSSPSVVATLQLPDAGPLCVTPNRLRFAGQTLPFSTYTYNIGQPENPVFIAQRRIMGRGRDIHAANNIMAIAEDIGGFELFDLLPSGRPPLIGRLYFSQACEGVYCGMNNLYVAAGTGGLLVYGYPALEGPAVTHAPEFETSELFFSPRRTEKTPRLELLSNKPGDAPEQLHFMEN